MHSQKDHGTPPAATGRAMISARMNVSAVAWLPAPNDVGGWIYENLLFMFPTNFFLSAKRFVDVCSGNKHNWEESY